MVGNHSSKPIMATLCQIKGIVPRCLEWVNKASQSYYRQVALPVWLDWKECLSQRPDLAVQN